MDWDLYSFSSSLEKSSSEKSSSLYRLKSDSKRSHVSEGRPVNFSSPMTDGSKNISLVMSMRWYGFVVREL